MEPIGIKIFEDRYAAAGETDPGQMMYRVARAVAVNEPNPAKWERIFREALDGWRFVPGGRILSGAGDGGITTLYNCYVLPSPVDSRGGIIDTLRQLTEIMSRGGGVGINLSSIRPRGGHVAGVNGQSSGAVSWGELYSFGTSLISQGGTRRGALMLVLEDWHPDILEFINAKRNEGRLTSANLSVGISDQFMDAVENNSDWDLVFPDTSDSSYDYLWDGDLDRWRTAGGALINHQTIPARELWDAICESAWASGEPGVWFTTRSRTMSNSAYYNRIVCVNPCGEEPLPSWGVCNLGALNLGMFFDENSGWDRIRLRDTIRMAVRFLDNVIDITPYFYEENRQQQMRERRIGLGTMGLADLLIMNDLQYGSPNAIKFTERLYRFICVEAYVASSDLAIERGSFPAFDATHFLSSGFAKSLPVSLRHRITRGLRNVTLLTAAPTGTTATMIGVSPGIEPNYAASYERTTALGTFAQDGGEGVTAMEITPAAHIAMQATIQRWTDAAISKTINLRTDATVQYVMDAFELMYESGVKGGCVYRDGSRAEQVLRCTDGECSI